MNRIINHDHFHLSLHFEYCFFRYNIIPFFSRIMEMDFRWLIWCVHNVTSYRLLVKKKHTIFDFCLIVLRVFFDSLSIQIFVSSMTLMHTVQSNQLISDYFRKLHRLLDNRKGTAAYWQIYIEVNFNESKFSVCTIELQYGFIFWLKILPLWFECNLYDKFK